MGHLVEAEESVANVEDEVDVGLGAVSGLVSMEAPAAYGVAR